MGQRAYRRDSSGRFAGSGGGTRVTMGRAGGFASANHRANVANKRAAVARRRALARKVVKVSSVAAVVGASAAVGRGNTKAAAFTIGAVAVRAGARAASRI